MSSMRIIQNPIDGKMCFAGKVGGRHPDFQHPVKQFRRRMLITKKAKEIIETNTLQRTKVPVDKIIQVLGQHFYLYHGQSGEMIEFLHSLEKKMNISLPKLENWTANDCMEEKEGKRRKFMEIEVPKKFAE